MSFDLNRVRVNGRNAHPRHKCDEDDQRDEEDQVGIDSSPFSHIEWKVIPTEHLCPEEGDSSENRIRHGISLMRSCEHDMRCVVERSEDTRIVYSIALSRFF